MNMCMHYMHPPKLDKGIMLIFVSEKNRPLLLAKGVCKTMNHYVHVLRRLNKIFSKQLLLKIYKS